jgi:hypothetical protein
LTDLDDIKTAIMKYGAVVASVDLGAAEFSNYSSGVINCTSQDFYDPESLVYLIGWGQDGDIPYWIAAPNLGPSWGQNGYFQIEVCFAL